MKNSKQKLKAFAKQLRESNKGLLEGGFTVILGHVENAAIVGGEETNNCNGGNCAKGCGLNTAAGCGGTVNSVAGCGTAISQ